VVAVLVDAGRMLFIQRGPGVVLPGYWTLPGGRIEPGESQPAALVREVREELGLTVVPAVKVWGCDTDDGEYRLHWWLAEVTGGELRPDPDEIGDIRWLPPEEFGRLAPTFAGDHEFFDRVWRTLTIDPRFNGPPGTGQGGYTSGLLGSRLGTTAQVTLRVPPPLDTPLRVVHGKRRIEVYAEQRLVAEAEPVSLDDPPPPPVEYAEAVAAASSYPGFVDHPFPTCYVCGPERADGLRIFPGPLPGGRTAAPWRVPDGAGAVTVWAALDCPGGWAIISAGRPYVLGRMAAQVRAVPPADAECVVVGALDATAGRKAEVRTALYAGDQLLAHSRATWLALSDSAGAPQVTER
jgi:8-oxo-dGTP pyrophosphatase MutT (NUDIX family)